MATNQKIEELESKRDLQIYSNGNQKESRRSLVTKINDKNVRVVPGYPGPNYLKLLDKNYREKLFNLDNVQGKLFRQMVECNIVPIKQKNVKNSCYIQLPRLDGSDHKDYLVHTDLVEKSIRDKASQISDFVVSSNNKKNFLNEHKPSILDRKRSTDKFKSELAHSFSMPGFQKKLSKHSLTKRLANLPFNLPRQVEAPPYHKPPTQKAIFNLTALKPSSHALTHNPDFNQEQSQNEIEIRSPFEQPKRSDPSLLIRQHKRFIKNNIRRMEKVRVDRLICHSQPKRKYEFDDLDDENAEELLIDL